MPHAVLLGDSIFDNAAYVGGGPDVATQLERILPRDWRVTLAAVDGAVVADVERQLAGIPRDSTHLVLSVGGNDALGHIDILDRPAVSMAEALDTLAAMGDAFQSRYLRLVERISRLGLPLTLCTIYNGNLPDPDVQRRASTALIVFNDVILRAALALGAGIIELRAVCATPGDYANPIEPSVQGGERIARAVREALLGA